MSDTSPYNQQQLAIELASGSESAFKQLYKQYWNKIYSLALAYLKSDQQAQDIVQEVFLKLWAKRGILKEVNNPDAYIYMMGRNEVLSALRKKARLGILEEPEDNLPDNLLLPHESVDVKELGVQVRQAIDSLPDQQKLIFKLSREEGLNHEQIAQRLGIEKATVKNHIVRALHKLRQQLGIHGNSLLFWYLLAEWFSS